jgi:putative transport protein
MIPLAIPGLPAPLRLGLAGGPLIVALILGRIGTLGKVVFYIPNNAAMALREIGIVLFLACVGLKSGSQFFEYLLDGRGIWLMFLGAVMTFLPLLATALVARLVARMPIPDTCGLLAGAMTDPPALAYAQQVHEGNATALAYATVYPLTMILRILSVQLMALLLL